MTSKRRKKVQKRAKRLTFIFIFLILFISISLLFFIKKMNTDTLSAPLSLTKNAVSKKTPTEKSVPLTEIQDTGNLVLVNSSHAVTHEPSEQSLSSVQGKIATLGNSPIFLKSVTLNAVSQLINQTQQAVGGNIAISSGFRSYNEQAALYDNAADKSYVQAPGHSEHETGLAADISIQNVQNVENSPQSQYLRANCWKYGLILRYPADKEQITGISNEPWHFRYIGEIHAWYCTTHNMAYEEYIAFLQKSGGYSQKLDGKTYTVSYQVPKNNEITVPLNAQYNLSSDNTGGYIVTSWK